MFENDMIFLPAGDGASFPGLGVGCMYWLASNDRLWRRDNSDLAMNPADTTLAKWLTWQAINCVIVMCPPPYNAMRRGQHFYHIFPQSQYPQSAHKEPLCKPKVRNEHSTICLISIFQRCQGHERQEKSNCHRMQDTKEVWPPNAVRNPGLDPVPECYCGNVNFLVLTHLPQ